MSELLSPGELAKIRRRHNDIPQEALFDPPALTSDRKPKRDKQPKSIAYATCPEHVGERKTGLITGPELGTVIFRDHTRKVGKVSMHCAGSGRVWDGDQYDTPKG